MAHSYCNPFQCNSQLNINRSLHTALQNSTCTSMKNLDDVIENGHFRFVPFEQNMLLFFLG